MTWLKAMLRRWAGAPATDITQSDMDTAYQLGFQNGRACGELNGRTCVLLEIELSLAARGKVLTDVEPEDVQAAKLRILH